MPKAWNIFIRRHTEIRHPSGEAFIDASLEKNGDQYLQLICIEVSQIEGIPHGMRAVEIPPQRYIHHQHLGPTSGIAETFGEMYDWARRQGRQAGDFKLDIEYSVGGDERVHDLFIGMLPETKWRYVSMPRGETA